MIRSIAAPLAAALLACCTVPPAGADTFRVFLGDRVLGTVTVEPPDGGSGRLATQMTNTPLGVGDGSFEARVSSDGTARTYASIGRSPGETRAIEVGFADGRVVSTGIDPPSEATALSDPDAVPSGVLDIVSGVARLTHATDCPAPFAMYDGRRVIRVSTTGRDVAADMLTCTIAYEVVAGPGHLSPLRFTSVAITARYGLSSGRVVGLAGLAARAGLFTIRVAP